MYFVVRSDLNADQTKSAACSFDELCLNIRNDTPMPDASQGAHWDMLLDDKRHV